MRALATLIRMRREALDERRQRLSAFETRLAALEREGERLEAQVRHEQEVAGQAGEVLFAYQGFATRVIIERERLAQARAAFEDQIVAAREDLAVAFSELKKFEVARDQRRRREHVARTRAEQKEFDEIALVRHRRPHTKAR
jgi:flagellar export protein FliJ